MALALSGDLEANLDRNCTGVTLTAGGNAALHYTGLSAHDAGGKELRAWLEVRGRRLLLKTDDANARYPVVVDPFVQLAELTASDGAPFDGLGISVGINGNTVVAGASGNESNTGAAYVFVEPTTGWANMTQTAKLTASDGQTDDELGVSVAIKGNTVVAGTPHATVGGGAGRGAVYVFVEPGGGWADMTETAKLRSSNAQDFEVGTSVAIDGNTVVSGSPGVDKAYVFVEPKTGWANEAQIAVLTSSDQGGDFGNSVSISGNTVVGGAPLAQGTTFETGAAYVFVEPPGGWTNMTPTATLTSPRPRQLDKLGTSVVVAGNTVVAGAPSPGGSDGGSAYVFVKPTGGWVSTTDSAKLTFSGEQAGDNFGSSVALSGDTVTVGAINVPPAGATFVFGRQ